MIDPLQMLAAKQQSDKMRFALEQLKKYNQLRNDLDAYLFALIEWALGERDKKPNPESFGLEAEK